MFVSYLFTRHNELMFGYMCFTGMVSEEKILPFLRETLFVKVVLIIARIPYTKKVKSVMFYNKSLGLQIMDYDKPLANVGEIGGLYTMLYRKHGFCNIVKFSGLQD